MSIWTENYTPRNFEFSKDYGVYMKDMTKPIEFDDEESLRKYIENSYDEVLFIKYRDDEKYKLFGSEQKHFDIINSLKKESFFENIWFPVLIIFVGLIFMLFFKNDFGKTARFWVLFLGVLPFVSNIYIWFKIKKSETQNNHQDIIDNNIFNYWIEHSKNNWYIYILPTILWIIFVLQMILRFSDYQKIEDLFALVKDKTIHGEYWRLISAAFLHANFMHIAANVSSLYFLSKIFLKFYNYFQLFAIFIITAIVGNLFSIIFYPVTTSLGASGGICGLLGFLIIFTYKNRNLFPLEFSKNMIVSVLFLVILGIVGYDFIDNAAHFGGLISGIITGFAIEKKELVEEKIKKSLKNLK